MEKILQYSVQKIQAVSQNFRRRLYQQVEKDDNKIVGLVWMRWIWKTTLLLQIAQQTEKSVYFSMDASFLAGESIFSMVETLKNDYGRKTFFIDEIHKYTDWQQDLKTIYDFIPDIKIYFSWSSSIDLIKWNYDLSRRGKLYHLQKFSFSEYLEFKYQIDIPEYSFEEIIESSSHMSLELYSRYNNISQLFHEYLQQWELWFSLHANMQDYEEKLDNIIHKMIYEDLSVFYALKTENIWYFLEILKFIANAAPSQVNYSSIAKLLHTTPNTVKYYTELLSELGFLNLMWKVWKISTQLRKTKKVYFEMQNFMGVFFDSVNSENYIWSIRESFVASLLNKKWKIFYPEKWDIEFHYKQKRYIFEIGGKNKTAKQITQIPNAYIIADEVNIGTSKKIPIWLMALLHT